MRIMKKGTQKIKVHRHIILKNFWEYYIIESDSIPYKDNDDIQFAYVLGFYDEFGDISINEIKPYILSNTTELKNVAPAPDWIWKDQKEV